MGKPTWFNTTTRTTVKRSAAGTGTTSRARLWEPTGRRFHRQEGRDGHAEEPDWSHLALIFYIVEQTKGENLEKVAISVESWRSRTRQEQ